MLSSNLKAVCVSSLAGVNVQPGLTLGATCSLGPGDVFPLLLRVFGTDLVALTLGKHLPCSNVLVLFLVGIFRLLFLIKGWNRTLMCCWCSTWSIECFGSSREFYCRGSQWEGLLVGLIMVGVSTTSSLDDGCQS